MQREMEAKFNEETGPSTLPDHRIASRSPRTIGQGDLLEDANRFNLNAESATSCCSDLLRRKGPGQAESRTPSRRTFAAQSRWKGSGASRQTAKQVILQRVRERRRERLQPYKEAR